MRIALVSDTYTPQVNGVTTVLRRIVRGLEAAQHHAAVVAPAYPQLQADGGERELRVLSLAFPPYPAIRLSLPAPRRVARFLDEFRPDVVHVATEGPLGLLGRHYALRRGLPLVTSFHTNFPYYCRHYGVPVLEAATWRWLTWFHRPARLIHTPGTAARETLHARGLRHAVLWGRGVDTQHFHHGKRNAALRHRLGLAERDTLVLHVGRLAAEKNIEALIQAWSLARAGLGARATFVVAGDGPLSATVTARMPWALRMGFLEADPLATLYASADLCVLPSATETCGLVALEALASGLPVVAADAGGFRDSVAHGFNGVLAPPTDPGAFAAAICALAFDAQLRQAMSGHARLAAVACDAAAEDQELLDHYGAVLGREPERDQWRAA